MNPTFPVNPLSIPMMTPLPYSQPSSAPQFSTSSLFPSPFGSSIPSTPLPQTVQQSLFPNPFQPQSTYQQGYAAGIADITQNHTYQALAGLSPSQLGGTNIQQATQQAAQASQTQGQGGLGGAIGGGITGAIIGGTVGSAIPVVGTGIGALLGGAGGALLGGFTPYMQTPQNAIVKGIQDIENGQAGNIPNDFLQQLIAKQAVPNYHQVFQNTFLNQLPNTSLLGNNNIPFLSGLTNPNVLGEFGFNVATNPFSYVGMPETGLGKLGAEDIANMGIGDEVKSITGSLANNELTRAGTAARNPIAQSLGYDSYASLVNDSKNNPDALAAFNKDFGNLIKANPSEFISNTALKTNIPFTNIGVPVMTKSFANSLSANPILQTANDIVSPFTNSIGRLFGQPLGLQQISAQFGNDTAQQVMNALEESKGTASAEQQQFLNKLQELISKHSPSDIQNAADMIEAGTPQLAKDQSALQDFLTVRNELSQYIKSNNPEALPFESNQYIPKVAPEFGSTNLDPIQSFYKDNLGVTPLNDINVPSASYLPAQVAKSAKEIQIGKFIAPDGQVIIGDPGELGIQRVERFQQPQDIKGLSQPAIGTAVGANGEPLYETYLPTAEANARYMKMYGKNLYEPNPVIAMAKSYLNANKIAGYNRFIDNVSKINTLDQNGELTPLIEDALTSKSTGKFLKSPVDQNIEQLGKGQLKGKVVPNGLMNLIKENYQQQMHLPNGLLNATNSAGNIARRFELLNPLYHPIHNITTNSLLGGVSPFKSLFNTAASYAPDAMETLNKDPLVQRMGNAGIELNGINDALKAGKTPVDALAKQFKDIGVEKQASTLLNKFNSYMANTNQAMELANKRDMFQSLIKKGLSDAEAANEINKILPTYKTLSDFEKNYLNNLFPFYQWMKNNTLLWARHPNEEAVMQGLFNTINERTSGHQMALNPQYKQTDLYLGNYNGQDMYTNPRLPFMDISNFSTNPLNFLESRINPAISTTAHLATNTDYQGNPIYNPNLPAGMQQKSLLGLQMDPRIAYAIQNSIIPLQSADKGIQPITPQSAANNILGTSTTQQKSDTKALQEYMAQKNMVDAIAKAELKLGNITYQQATPYNTSPGTQKFMNSLQQNIYNLQDQLYGYHYIGGNKVYDNSKYTTKHYAALGRRHSYSLMRNAKHESSYSSRKTREHFKVPHIKL